MAIPIIKRDNRVTRRGQPTRDNSREEVVTSKVPKLTAMNADPIVDPVAIEGSIAQPTDKVDIIDTPKPVIVDTTAPTIGKPTATDSVFDGDSSGSQGGKRVNIFDGLDSANVTDEISGGTELGNKLAKEIRNRRSIEATTGNQDPILNNIGFSTVTVKDADEDGQPTVSIEGSRKVAEDLIGQKIKGIAPGLEFNDGHVRRYLESEGYDSNQITAILDSRDAILKEERVEKDLVTVIEKERERIKEVIQAEEVRVQESVDKTMNITQRQRSLRGVGLSSGTEEDLRVLQKQGDAILDAFSKEKNATLSLFEAQQNNAGSEAISAIRKTLREAITGKNNLIKQNADTQSKLVAQGKIDANLAFESLVNNLDFTDAEKGEIDETASNLTGRLSDKFGNAITIDGEKFPVGGTSSAQAEDIQAYVSGIINGDLPSLGSVPAELRTQVTKALALRRASMGTLSFEKQALAQALAKKHFGNTKEDGINSIEGMLLDGKTEQEIDTILNDAGFSTQYTGVMRDIFGNIAGALTSDSRDYASQEFNRRLEEGRTDSAIQTLLSVAKETESTATQDKMQGRIDLLNNIQSLKDYLTEYEEEGGDIGKIPGGKEALAEWALGKTTNPRLGVLQNLIDGMVQSYRAALSGAAFSESESKAYEKIFPSSSKTLELNVVKIASLSKLFIGNTENFYRQKFGATEYDEVFTNGVLPFLLPGTDYDTRPEEPDFSKINADMSDDEIADIISNNMDSGGFGGVESDFDIDDDEAANSFLDEGFSLGDQPSGSKDVPQEGFTLRVDIPRTGNNVAIDTNNPGNITADSIPTGQTMEGYGKAIGATGTYLSPNGREYFVFPNVDGGIAALERDITAKMTGGSRNIKPTDTLARFQRVYVGATEQGYLNVLTRITGASEDTQIKDIDPSILARAVMKAEGFM